MRTKLIKKFVVVSTAVTMFCAATMSAYAAPVLDDFVVTAYDRSEYGEEDEISLSGWSYWFTDADEVTSLAGYSLGMVDAQNNSVWQSGNDAVVGSESYILTLDPAMVMNTDRLTLQVKDGDEVLGSFTRPYNITKDEDGRFVGVDGYMPEWGCLSEEEYYAVMSEFYDAIYDAHYEDYLARTDLYEELNPGHYNNRYCDPTPCDPQPAVEETIVTDTDVISSVEPIVVGDSVILTDSFDKFQNVVENNITVATPEQYPNGMTFDTNNWISFSHKTLESFDNAKVDVTIRYAYKGKKYAIKIPKGTNLSKLIEGQDYVGFEYLASLFGKAEL